MNEKSADKSVLDTLKHVYLSPGDVLFFVWIQVGLHLTGSCIFGTVSPL